MSIIINGLEMPQNIGRIVTIYPDGRVTEPSIDGEQIVGNAVETTDMRTMSDYISRKENIEAIRSECERLIDSLKAIPLEVIPLEDARTMVRGKWIPKLTQFAESADICSCSVCGNPVWIYKDNSQPWNFCPNCGADMREVKTV